MLCLLLKNSCGPTTLLVKELLQMTPSINQAFYIVILPSVENTQFGAQLSPSHYFKGVVPDVYDTDHHFICVHLKKLFFGLALLNLALF